MGIMNEKMESGKARPDDEVFYATPFGDTRDGEKKLFMLQRDGVLYFPVFRSVESMKQFYERMNRVSYMILEGDIRTVIGTLRSIELLKNAGIVIEPLSEQPVEIRPNPS